jgi:hypothetical protein
MRVKGPMRWFLRAGQMACLGACWLGATPVLARGIADVLRSPRFNHLELAPIAPALASTVASTYPVASASSSVTYVYNPELDAPERQPGVAGPIIGERAHTLGRGQFDMAATYSYVHLTSINGDDLSGLVNRRRVNGRTVVFPVPGGLTLQDGRFTNFLPVHVNADLDVEAHIVAPSVTYGVTPDLDVNATLPLLHTRLSVTAKTQVPDPRFPKFALPPGDPNAQQGSQSDSDDSTGVGDLLLRAKQVLLRSEYVDAAAGLGLSLPTGSQDNLQGTGTTRIQPTLILSHTFANRVEPLLNVGLDYNANDVNRSVVRWAVGGTAQVVEPLAFTLVFLGRHELAPQGQPIATPFFFQLERNDQYDASVGLRWRFAEAGSVGLNAIVPLNSDGLRPDAIPTCEFEYAF